MQLTTVTLAFILAAIATANPVNIEERRSRRYDVPLIPWIPDPADPTGKNMTQVPMGTVDLCTRRNFKDCTRKNAYNTCLDFTTPTSDLKHVNKLISSLRVGPTTDCVFYMAPGCNNNIPDNQKLGTWAKIDWRDLSYHRAWPKYEDKFQSCMCW